MCLRGESITNQEYAEAAKLTGWVRMTASIAATPAAWKCFIAELLTVFPTSATRCIRPSGECVVHSCYQPAEQKGNEARSRTSARTDQNVPRKPIEVVIRDQSRHVVANVWRLRVAHAVSTGHAFCLGVDAAIQPRHTRARAAADHRDTRATHELGIHETQKLASRNTAHRYLKHVVRRSLETPIIQVNEA